MGWLIKLIAPGILSALTAFIKPLFDFLNTKVQADARKHISDNATIAGLGGAAIQGQSQADALNADIRKSEGKWSPWTIVTIGGFMLPFGWHTWQVVLDSSRWLPSLGFWYGIPYPTVTEHSVGSWRVAALPGLFETTEHAVIGSLFIGAGVALSGIALIKAMRGR